MAAIAFQLETRVRTGLDRPLDQPLSSLPSEDGFESSFEATAGSAPLNQEVGEKSTARVELRADACAGSRPPTPNDGIGWPGISLGMEEK